MRNDKRWIMLPFLFIFTLGIFASDPSDESVGYVRINRNSGICTFYLKEGTSGKLVPITNESRSTTSPNFGTIKYNGDTYKTTASRFQLNVQNITNGFLIERKSSFVSYVEEVTVVNQLTEKGGQRFFNIKLTVKNLKPKPAKIEFRYVFDSFSKESQEAILLNRHQIVRESLLIENFSSINDVGYVTDFHMKPIWFTPEKDTRQEVDFVVISNWKKLNNSPWFSRNLLTGDFFSYPESRTDTALAFYFKEITLEQNESVSYSFQLEGGTLSSQVRDDLINSSKDPAAKEALGNKEENIGESGTPVTGAESVASKNLNSNQITVTEKIIDDLLEEINEQMLRVDTLSPEELANLQGKIETLERYKEVYEKAQR